MQLALECPPFLMRDIQPLADYDWILTHLVLQDETYAQYYREHKRFRVLDNSVNELMEPCSLEDMTQALDILGGADLVVPPDYLGDSKKTLESLEVACKSLDNRILPCIQGGSLDEVIECAKGIRNLGFKRIAVPYDIICKRTDLVDTMAFARATVVEVLSDLEFDDIHLLGFTTLDEFAYYRDFPNLPVKSIDTGVPVLWGMNLKYLNETWAFKKDKPTLQQMDQDMTDFVASLRIDQVASDKLMNIFWNIAYLRKVLSGIR